MRRILVSGALCALAVCWLPAEDVGTIPDANPPLYALTGATVVVGNGEVISNATVVVRDGLIESVGPAVAVPDHAWKIDAQGLFVYPGLIDALTSDGLKRQAGGGDAGQRGQRGRGGDSPQGEESEEGPGMNAHHSAADMVHASDKKLESWRQAGITTLHVTPDDGIFQGTTAVINLNGREADQMIVQPGTAMSMAFESQGFRTYPGSLMGVIAHVRQTLHDARHYQQAWAEYDRDKRGMKRPETDRTLAALAPVVEGSMPMIFPAKRAREIRRSLALCAEVQARCIVAGGYEADEVAGELGEAAVLLSLDYPKKPRDPHPEEQESVSELRYRVMAPAAAGRLAEAGVRFAFYSDGASAKDFLGNIRKAVERGLPKDAAIRAATLGAAEILGVEQQLGSVEAGKIANLVVADADLFDEGAQIQKVFVDGVLFDVPTKPKKEAGDDEAPVTVAGTWEVEVQAPGQTHEMVLDLTQDGQTLTGTVSSDMGSLEFYDGSVNGNAFTLKFETDPGHGVMTEITLSATVEGDSMTGTATVAGMGSAPMEGRRVPR